MSEEVKKLFSAISPTYDRLNHLLSFNADRRWRRETIRKIGDDGKKNIRALDLCAGTLDLSLEFLRQFPNGKVWALDFSADMLARGMAKVGANGLSAEASAKADNSHLRDRIQTVCADALKMPFPSEFFDVVFCGFGFRNFDNQKAALGEIGRVLKPGGQLLILEFFRPTNIMTRIFHKTYGNIVLPLVGGLISGRKEAYRYLHRSIADFYSLEECKELMDKNGFSTTYSRNFSMGVSSLIVGEKRDR